MSSFINPLACAKEAKKLCELCQKPAHIQCKKCRVAFYCDKDHQHTDWVGIHERVCQLLIPLRTLVPFQSQQVVRDHHRTQILQRQEQLIMISRGVAQKNLFEGRHQEALPAALLSLRSAIDIYGPSGIQLVSAYLLLAQANIGLGNSALAAEYLSQAEWIVMKTPNCSNTVHHQLHRNLGRLCIAMGNHEEALLHLANDVYYASEEYGVDSIVTCGGYFLMANVFFKQEKSDIAKSLYEKVVNTWHCYLSKLLESHTKSSSALKDALDEGQLAEADQMLQSMLEDEEQDPKLQTNQTMLVAHALAMLWYLSADLKKAQEFGRRALLSTQLVPNCHLTEPIQRLLQLAEAGDSLKTGNRSSSPGSPQYALPY